MAFLKTSVAYSAPTLVSGSSTSIPGHPEVGEEREGRIWDGEKWISKVEWDHLHKEDLKDG